MNGLEAWIVPIVSGIIALLAGAGIVELVRRYLQKRDERKKTEEGKPTPEEGIQLVPGTEAERRSDLAKKRLPRMEEKKPRVKKREPKTEEIEDVIEVEAGGFEALILKLKEGTEVTGLAEETNNREFSLYVLNREGYSDYRNDMHFDSLFELEDMIAIPFRFRIPKTGKWYFVFDAFRKQYFREIEFECTIFPKE